MNNLQDKAIDIKGKDYILVKDRVLFFNEKYPNGKIETVLLSDFNAEMVVMKAIVTPDVEKPLRAFTGHSQATWGDGMVNKTAAMENCETSAVGRALGFMGIGVIDSIASVDEINKAQTQPAYKSKTPPPIANPDDLRTIVQPEKPFNRVEFIKSLQDYLPPLGLNQETYERVMSDWGINDIQQINDRKTAKEVFLELKSLFEEQNKK
jgi:hypothetical protein